MGTTVLSEVLSLKKALGSFLSFTIIEDFICNDVYIPWKPEYGPDPITVPVLCCIQGLVTPPEYITLDTPPYSATVPGSCCIQELVTSPEYGLCYASLATPPTQLQCSECAVYKGWLRPLNMPSTTLPWLRPPTLLQCPDCAELFQLKLYDNSLALS